MTGPGVLGGVAALTAGAAVGAWPVRGAAARLRVRVLATAIPRDLPPEPNRTSAGAARLAAAVAAGGGSAMLVGLPWGLGVGLIVAVVAGVVLGRLEPVRVRQRRQRIAADLPIAVDLLAACLRSGSAPVSAVDAVGQAVAGPVGEALGGVVAMLRLGGDPVDCWVTLCREPALAPLGRTVGRATASGAPLADVLEHLAGDCRERRRSDAEAAAKRVGVRAAAPLGLCFLPAFVLLGVVPIAAGIAQGVDLW
jgi:Flp pilus assembly protein TadB